MSKISAARWLVAGSLLSGVLASGQAPSPATLNIDLGKPLHKVSPMLYGLMTEEINYSYDGGLYAEMVRNRTFSQRDHGGAAHWFLVEEGHGSGAMGIDLEQGPSEALTNSLRVEVKEADAQNQVGVLNDGWWGYAVRPNTTYKGSFYAKAESGDVGPVRVSLIGDNTAKVLATATTEALSSGWKKYEFTLKTGALEATTENHLRLTVGHPGKFWIDLISLFPPTYKGRENGNRPDLMEKMAAMKPTFLRLPGGNYLEGDEIQDWYNWKITLGPLVDRPTHPSPWKYQSTDGMGLLEFLEWTEDLKMEPVLAVYAGYALKTAHINAGPALQPYVDAAIEEIEFVTGDTSTKWGAVRAKLGHPAPFPLTYVEIGNEDWFDKSGSYEGRFAQFNKAIKAKYPKLQVIATMPLKGTKPDVVDDHFYRRATQFFEDTKHYDNVDRNGPKIFVGEWATREGMPTTNMGAALGDAAWMTGMERNSDLIVLSAYAPLFVNVNPGGMQWESDLIGYDAMSSFGSPGYYAQALFASHLGTEVPTSTISGEPKRVFYSVTNDAAEGVVYLKLVNANSVAQPMEIKMDGAPRIAKEGTLWTLSGSTTSETNTIKDPTRLVPVRSVLKNMGASFSHTVPPYSVEVMEGWTK